MNWRKVWAGTLHSNLYSSQIAELSLWIPRNVYVFFDVKEMNLFVEQNVDAS